MDTNDDYTSQGKDQKGYYFKLKNDNEKFYYDNKNDKSIRYAYSKIKKKFRTRMWIESGNIMLIIPK